MTVFKTYSQELPCGFLEKPIAKITVPVNCDSATFMKDGNTPTRLFNGTSDYQDRPLHSISASIIYKIALSIGLPDKKVVINGLTGKQYTYSYLLFGIFVAINGIILFSSLLLLKIAVERLVLLKKVNKKYINLLFLNVFFVAALNETTKTFFWTPHSQMFNVLVPCYSLYLYSNSEKFAEKGNFLRNYLILLFLCFFYPLFILSYIFLVGQSNFKTIKKILYFLVPPLILLLYPIFIRLIGGKYKNTAVLKFREFVWAFDYLKNPENTTLLFGKINNFVFSIHLTLILSIFVFLVLVGANFKNLTTKIRNQFDYQILTCFVFAYFAFIFGMGLFARRMTVGINIFIEVLMLVFISSKFQEKRTLPLVLTILSIYQILCWAFTFGPLQ
jgi:hypothetical protein